MKERILLAPYVSGTELMRTLAAYGQPTFGLRIMGEAELAQWALMKCGKAYDREIVDTGKAQTLLYRIIKDAPYFENASFSDAVNMLATLTKLREMITQNEQQIMQSYLSGGEFPGANKALFSVYEKYLSSLDTQGLSDTVGFLRYAYENAEPLDTEIMLLEQYPASALANSLADKLSGGRAETVTLQGLFGLEDDKKAECRVVRSFGTMNEARDILDEIVKSGLPFDKCLVACADTSSLPLMMRELSEEYKIPMTFGCGMPINITSPARLLSLTASWLTEGKCGVDGLDSVIFANEFDTNKLIEDLSCTRKELHKAVSVAGNLRLSLDSEENAEKISALKETLDTDSDNYKALLLAKKLFDRLEKGIAAIIDSYAFIRPACKVLDKAAVSSICSSLSACRDTDECLEMLPAVMNSRVCSELSREGCLHITDISRASVSLRESIFAAGLTAASFPGAAKENYLICDKDMLRFDDNADTSEKQISDKRKAFFELLALAGAAGCRVRLSYSGYDTAQLKENNPSSVLFEGLREQMGEHSKPEDFEKAIESKGYFAAGFSVTDKAAKAYSEGVDLEKTTAVRPDIPKERKTDITINVSDVGTFCACQKKFYYSSILGLKTPESDDPMSVIAANTLGSLFHNELMEPYGKRRIADEEYSITEEEFIDEAYRVWDRFILSRPPIDKNKAIRQRNEFANMALNAYRFESKNKVMKAEEKHDFEHSKGFTVTGRFDRLEKLPSGAVVVADYKTGKSDGYKDNDPASCIQVLLYAFLLENDGEKVSMGEYRFVKGDAKKVSCSYSNDSRDFVIKLLDEIGGCIENDSFAAAKRKGDCKYCEYKDICTKEGDKK